MARSRNAACRCRRGHGCKADAPDNLKVRAERAPSVNEDWDILTPAELRLLSHEACIDVGGTEGDAT